MKTRACIKKLIADLKSASQDCVESVKKSHATKNKNKFVDQCLSIDWDTIIRYDTDWACSH